MPRAHARSSAIAAYNDRSKNLCVNPRDRENYLSISIKDNAGLVLISIFVSVMLGWSITLYASEEPPLDVNWARNLITSTMARGHREENLFQEIEAINPKHQTVKLVFKPAVNDWKFAQFSILDRSGLIITEARATPPCNFISIRSLVKTADGDPAIVSFGPNLKKLGFEPQNPPLVLSESIHHRSSKPLLALVDTGVNYNYQSCKSIWL